MKKWVFVLLTMLMACVIYPQVFSSGSMFGGSSSSGSGSAFGSSFTINRDLSAGQTGSVGIPQAIEVGAGGEIMRINPDEYIVKPGDQFFIRYMSERIFTAVFPTGSLSLFPFAPDMMAAGKTVTEIYKEIYKNLPPDISPESVFIEFFQIAPSTFYMLGAVNKSGQYYVSGTINLISALQLAGGHYNSASRVITIFRNGEELTYNLNDLYVNHDVDANPMLQHNDIVVVKFAEKFARIFTDSSEVESMEIIGDEKLTIEMAYGRLNKKLSRARVEMVTVYRDGKYFSVDNDFVIKHGDRVYFTLEEMFVYVTGNVRTPGKIPYQGVQNVHYYISQAGGVGAVGSTIRIMIVNDKGKYRAYDGQNIAPGDIIYVPETYRNIMSSYLTPIGSLLSVISSILILSGRL